MREISKEQLADASGQIAQSSKAEGLVFQEAKASYRFPSFDQIKLLLGTESQNGFLALDRNHNVRPIAGATIIAGVKQNGRNGFLPGKVLPDGRVGVLASSVALRSKDSINKPLSDIEKILLTKFYLEQNSDTEHVEGAVNTAKLGLGVIVAAATQSKGLHGLVHDFEGKDFVPELLRTPSTRGLDIPTSKGDFPARFMAIDIKNTAGLVAFANHQFPDPGISKDSFDITAGLTHVIRGLQERPADLHANSNALLEPY